jgi:pyruvate dehydrogenase kinase 2/3/4
MRATALTHGGATVLPAVYVTIVAGENDVSLRISDQGL